MIDKNDYIVLDYKAWEYLIGKYEGNMIKRPVFFDDYGCYN